MLRPECKVLGVGDIGGKIVHVPSAVTSFVIPKHSAENYNSSAQGILFVTQNGNSIPTIYMCRRAGIEVLYQGTIDISGNVTFAENGDMTVTKPSGMHVYYRMFVME